MNVLSTLIGKVVTGVLIAALIAGAWYRGDYYAKRAHRNEALLSSALAVANANAEVARLQAGLAKKVDAVAAVNAVRKRDSRTRSDIRRKAITDAPFDDDGPLAPVLRDQLDRLPEPPN